MSLLALCSALTTRASGLHPLKTTLPAAELHVTLHGASRPNEEVVVECVYRPHRARGVRREYSLHLFDILPWRVGSRDALSVHREEANRVLTTARATDTTVNVTVPLRHPDPAYRDYQLDSVRIDRVEFGRWFASPPSLDPAFGLTSSATALNGTVRLGGLGAAPLEGRLPLWPGLGEVNVTISSVAAPTVQLWDYMTKHHWDGWRTSMRESWPGGATMVARHLDAPVVFRSHEYYSISPADGAALTRPPPPAGVLPGIGLEVYWPEGDTLVLPDVCFDRPAAVTPLRLAQLTPRAKALLARSVEPQPGAELNSLSADEWKELEALIDETVPAPLEFALRQSHDGKDVMTLQRLELTEPWVYLFGVEYDSDRRVAMNAMVVTPTAWSGPVPD